jgi:sulfoacetaldehyde dehydrogenase
MEGAPADILQCPTRVNIPMQALMARADLIVATGRAADGPCRVQLRHACDGVGAGNSRQIIDDREHRGSGA